MPAARHLSQPITFDSEKHSVGGGGYSVNFSMADQAKYMNI